MEATNATVIGAQVVGVASARRTPPGNGGDGRSEAAVRATEPLGQRQDETGGDQVSRHVDERDAT
jgi:hypothetical protein